MKNMSRNEIAEVLKTRIPCFDNRVLYIMGGEYRITVSGRSFA